MPVGANEDLSFSLSLSLSIYFFFLPFSWIGSSATGMGSGPFFPAAQRICSFDRPGARCVRRVGVGAAIAWLPGSPLNGARRTDITGQMLP